MNEFQLTYRFFRFGEPAFGTKVRFIVESLTTAPMLTLVPDPWPTTFPSRAELQTARTEYDDALLASESGDKAAIRLRATKRKVLQEILRRVGAYLESAAIEANNLAILDNSGFDRRMPVPHSSGLNGTLPAPEFKVRHGTLSGTLRGDAKRQREAGSYEGQITSADPTVESNFKTAVISKRATHILFTDVTPGTLYHLRLRGIGSTGPGAWSEVFSIYAV